MTDPLRALRDQIDALDDELLKLVNRRAEHARQIGHLKQGGLVYRAEREAQVLRRLAGQNPGPLPASAVLRVFTEVISACRSLEDGLTVAYLGPRGTYSEEAGIKQFGGSAELLPCASIDEVFRSVESGGAGYGLVPVENSTEGAVGRTMDLLLATPLKICGEVLLAVHHCLLGKAAETAAVSKVYSHAQSLAQCQGWLNRWLPQAERVAVASNAEAARLAAQQPTAAAIAGEGAAAFYQLSILARNIEDQPNNTTRFLVLGAHDAAASGKDKTSLVMSAPNQPGAVHGLLAPLARHQVSMTRFESRPSRTGLWEYLFFLDIEGHREDEPVARALEELREQAPFLKILGSYPVAVG